ncbi:MAG: FeoC-like transcriptional regulator [Methylococcales bacterium]|nr:FeoC-like transcriptional regulator [Methylococcales bacterium]
MILSDIRDYVQNHRRVALNDLVQHFQLSPDALRAMLAKWLEKGRIRKTTLEKDCGSGCCRCDSALTEIYEWVER